MFKRTKGYAAGGQVKNKGMRKGGVTTKGMRKGGYASKGMRMGGPTKSKGYKKGGKGKP